MGNKHTTYSEAYIETCFLAWYQKGCPIPRLAVDMNVFPQDEAGRVVEYGTLKHWITDRGWYQRRDEIDAEVSVKAVGELVAHKVMIVREQLAQNRAVRHKSFLHLIENPFDSSAAASSSFFKSSQQELLLVGVEEFMKKIADMQTPEIKARFKELAERAQATDVIDVAEVPESVENTEPLD